MRLRGAGLPDFPWDTIAEAKRQAAAHPDGIVNLSVGTPVDPVAPVIRAALSAAADVSGYPQTHGTPQLRAAAVEAMRRRFDVAGIAEDAVLPTIGSKELVAGLPRLLGLGSDDLVVIPNLAYPTYEVGCLLAGAPTVRADTAADLEAHTPALIYLNSPANPTGRVLDAIELRAIVRFAREHGAIVASDECYLGMVWEADHAASSILHAGVCDGDHTGLLAIHSLSKASNLAGYRAGFVTGDPALVSQLLAVRRHTGLMVPFPVQVAMAAALCDEDHAAEQRARYRRRRELLRSALVAAGFRIDHSEAGLYLWATRDEPGRDTLDRLARLGILVAPGDFYGPAGEWHVRLALTATDERIRAAVDRLSVLSPLN